MATPRANGQVETTEFNSSQLSSSHYSSAGAPEDRWDEYLKKVQSGINCTVNRTTQKSPAQLLYG